MDKRDGGTNARPLNDTVAGTGPGIPDDSLTADQEGLPGPPADEEVARAARKLGADEKTRRGGSSD